MAKELRQSLEKLRAAADITRALAAQMAELLELREAVQRAEEATARKRPKQRHREIISAAYRARADARGMEAQVKRRPATRRGSQIFSNGSWGLRFNFTRGSSRRAYSKRHKENKSSPRQIIHAIAVAMKKAAAAFWRPGLFSNDRRCPPKLVEARQSH